VGFLPQSKSIYSAAWNWTAFVSYGVGEEIQIALNRHEAKEFITGSETEYNPLECTRYIMWKSPYDLGEEIQVFFSEWTRSGKKVV